MTTPFVWDFTIAFQMFMFILKSWFWCGRPSTALWTLRPSVERTIKPFLTPSGEYGSMTCVYTVDSARFLPIYGLFVLILSPTVTAQLVSVKCCATQCVYLYCWAPVVPVCPVTAALFPWSSYIMFHVEFVLYCGVLGDLFQVFLPWLP